MFSNGSSQAASSSRALSHHSMAITAVYCLFGIFTFSGNLLVLYTYVKVRLLRTKTNKLMVSSSFCGIIVSIVYVPFYLVLDHLINSVSTTKIPVSSLLSSFCGFVTLFHVAFITVERYIAVFYSLRYQKLLTTRRLNLMLLFVWLVPLLLSVTPVFFSLTLQCRNELVRSFKIYQGFLAVLLCLIIMTVFAAYVRMGLLSLHFVNADIKQKASLLQNRTVLTNSEAKLHQRNGHNGFMTDMNSTELQFLKTKRTFSPLLSKLFRSSFEEPEKETMFTGKQSASAPSSPSVNASPPLRSTYRSRNSVSLQSLPVMSNMSPDLARIKTGADQRNNFAEASRCSSFASITQSCKSRVKNLLTEIRVAKIIAIIFIINAVCWLPLIFINFTVSIGRQDWVTPHLITAAQILFLTNSLLMPYIYAFCKRDFKLALMKLISNLLNK